MRSYYYSKQCYKYFFAVTGMSLKEYVWSSHIYIYINILQRVDQPGEVANPGRGQVYRENEYFLDCYRSRLRITVLRDAFGRHVPHQPIHFPKSA